MDSSFTTEDEKYTDTHTIYLQVRGLEIHEVQRGLEQWMHDEAIGGAAMWHVNYVMNARNEFLGFAYLWVADPAVFHILMGRNPDGSLRQRIIYNNIGSEDDKAFLAETWNWPDEDKDKKAELVQPDFGKEGENETPPMTVEILPPLIDVSAIEDSKGNAVMINVLPAFVRASELCCSLVIRNVPPGLSKQYLLDMFKPYSSIKEYPIVNVASSSKDSRTRAFIYFHPHTRDACFAMLMRRKFTFESTTVLVDYDNSSVATEHQQSPAHHHHHRAIDHHHQRRRTAPSSSSFTQAALKPPPGCAPLSGGSSSSARRVVTKK